jgi:hypothetical protein
LVVALLACGTLLLRPAAARAALFAPSTSSGAATRAPVSTLAQVSVAYPSAERSGIVVTIDYSKD